jgi:hypothetical protein
MRHVPPSWPIWPSAGRRWRPHNCCGRYNRRMNMPIKYTLAVLAGGFFAVTAHAQSQWDGWDYNFDREVTSWNEMQAQLPAYPRDGALLPLNVSAVTTHRYFVDEKSVSTGNDGVVRYTLVIKTSGGATNVSFEGIRCETREQKYYAIGRADGSWVRARNPQWRRIEFQQVNAHHITLYGEYACEGKFVRGSAEQIVAALRRGPERPQSPD